jgi:hypothetical protein
MTENFGKWGQKRIDEIPNDAKVLPENKEAEIGKLKDRLGKFKDKMGFLTKCQELTLEAREKKNLLIAQAEQAQNGASKA